MSFGYLFRSLCGCYLFFLQWEFFNPEWALETELAEAGVVVSSSSGS